MDIYKECFVTLPGAALVLAFLGGCTSGPTAPDALSGRPFTCDIAGDIWYGGCGGAVPECVFIYEKPLSCRGGGGGRSVETVIMSGVDDGFCPILTNDSSVSSYSIERRKCLFIIKDCVPVLFDADVHEYPRHVFALHQDKVRDFPFIVSEDKGKAMIYDENRRRVMPFVKMRFSISNASEDTMKDIRSLLVEYVGEKSRYYEDESGVIDIWTLDASRGDIALNIWSDDDFHDHRREVCTHFAPRPKMGMDIVDCLWLPCPRGLKINCQ